MMRNPLLATFTLGAMVQTAQAGDPCPIKVTMVNLGLPADAKPVLPAAVAAGDSFFDAMRDVGSKQACSEVQERKVVNDATPLHSVDADVPEKFASVAHLKTLLVDKKNAFQCAKAKTILKPFKNLNEEDGAILFMRGHRRVLFQHAFGNGLERHGLPKQPHFGGRVAALLHCFGDFTSTLTGVRQSELREGAQRHANLLGLGAAQG